MSVLIKGMAMPKNCTECNFGVDGWCYAKSPTEPNSKSLATHTRPTWCPLVELPPHGRLIDADAFEYTCKFNYCNGCEDWNGLQCKTCWVDDMLGELNYYAPTIIESEGE